MPPSFAVLARIGVSPILVLLACASQEVPSSGAAGKTHTPADPGAGAGGAEPAPVPQGGAPPSEAGQGGVAADAAGQPAHGDAGEAAVEPAGPPQLLELTGAIAHVHDPSIVRDGDTFYLFSTGEGISVRTSSDLESWTGAGSVFEQKPSWITTTDPGNPNHLWAPEVRYFGGKFHLYYSASKFGSNQSCIGHATRSSLASGAWLDQGEPLLCSNVGSGPHDYNAIDPSPFQDEEGKLWLAFGSFWTGLKLIRLDQDGRRDGPDFFALSTRPNTAVEAPYLHYRDGYYYLFESVDACCQGANSSYKVMVGRSENVTGPYVDASGKALLDGGGTLLLQGDTRWRGPGHNAILVDGQRAYNVYHSYDAQSSGTPFLRIAELGWDDTGWPVSAGP